MILERRNRILSYTSAWILLPILNLKMTYFDNILLMLFPTTFIISFLHWANNEKNSTLHKLDIYGSITLATFLYLYQSISHLVVTTVLLVTAIVLFKLQRWLQEKKEINWDIITIIHLLFRYFMFWFAMFATARPVNNQSVYSVIDIVVLSVLYLLSIIAL